MTTTPRRGGRPRIALALRRTRLMACVDPATLGCLRTIASCRGVPTGRMLDLILTDPTIRARCAQLIKEAV